MKFYVSLFIILPALAFAQPADAPYRAYVDNTVELLQVDAPITPPVALDVPQGEVLPVETTIEEQIATVAQKWGINGDKFYALVRCENNTFDPTRQSDLKYTFSDSKRGIVKGSREDSHGLAMIHRPDWPEITYEQMTSADWSLNWMAEHLSNGRASMWKICSKKAGF